MTQHWIKATYNYNTDETKISTSKNWYDLPPIHRLDALKDAIFDMQEIYEADYERFIDGEEV